ncbi:hypothetical protein HO173_012527 [Letharia columbiana]|uniref:Signal peptidase subunit 3 n=1 Tax=Letharia columbiana TaxID=112416 RepID=A0A8H6CM37_9LECA|nr:uncharacterized protein HO173_012527 [Letharia columbiana]KAF6226037.1 hypothetical protein HO173_012527 [Letharia columbiana]
MHSTLVRAQNVFGFFTTVAFCTAILTALSVVFTTQEPSAKIELRNVQVVKGRPHYYSPKKEEYAHIKFDLDADFTSLFNWNTKQLFVWVVATYPSPDASSLSQAVIWDTIINSHSQSHPFNPLQLFTKPPPAKKSSKAKKQSAKKQEVDPEPGILRLKNTKPKYQVTDISGILAERTNVTLEIGWNVQPWVGALTWTLGEGQVLGRWKGVEGGKSKAFDMPPLKKKSVGSETVVSSGETPQAAEASAVI